jgi:hypothetical protein
VIGVQDLERDALIELYVRRDGDHTHTARTEEVLDPVLAAEDRSDLDHLRQDSATSSPG